MENAFKKPLFVRDCYLFSGLNEEEFQGVGRITTFHSLKKNDSVFFEGDKAEGFFFLCQGRVKLFKTSIEGKEQLLHIVYPGETFAEAAMFEGNIYPATAQVMDDSDLLFIDKKGFLSLLKRHPEIGLRMLGNISRYLHHFTRLVEDLSLKEVSSRLAKYFLDVMDRDGIPLENGVALNLDIDRSDLAARLGTVRETLSRTLRTFRDKGVIEVRGKKILILDKDALGKISEGAKP